MSIIIENFLIDPSIFTTHFECNLTLCRGECCVQGDGGAPLTREETIILEEEYANYSPFLTNTGNEVISKKGKYIKLKNSHYETPLINGKECAYAIRSGKITLCGIEGAFIKGKTKFQKPISCHLYPIRVKILNNGLTYLFYEQWNICSPACRINSNKKVPIFQFVKDAIIRAYGDDFYHKLSDVAKSYQSSLKDSN